MPARVSSSAAPTTRSARTTAPERRAVPRSSVTAWSRDIDVEFHTVGAVGADAAVEDVGTGLQVRRQRAGLPRLDHLARGDRGAVLLDRQVVRGLVLVGDRERVLAGAQVAVVERDPEVLLGDVDRDRLRRVAGRGGGGGAAGGVLGSRGRGGAAGAGVAGAVGAGGEPAEGERERQDGAPATDGGGRAGQDGHSASSA